MTSVLGIDANAISPTTDPTAAIAAVGIEKSFGPVHAVTGLTLAVGRGEMVALLGPNGAGKTTTIGMLLGELRPDQGSVLLFGQDPRDAVAAGRVGAMLQDGGLMPGVRVGELLTMLAGLYTSPLLVGEAVATAQLEGLERRRVDRLSGGQTQRLRLAVALIGNPDLLVLDEPTAAMDVEARRTFWEAMQAEAECGLTIVFSTHYLEEADAFSDRVVVIGNGRVLADGSPSSIKASISTRVLTFTVDAPAARCEPFRKLPGVESVAVHDQRITLRSRESAATLRALLADQPAARDIEISGVGLEEAFLTLTSTSQTN